MHAERDIIVSSLPVCHILVLYSVCLSVIFWYCILSICLSHSGIVFYLSVCHILVLYCMCLSVTFWYCILSVCLSVCHILVLYSI